MICSILVSACVPAATPTPSPEVQGVIEETAVQVLIQEFSLEPQEIAIHAGTTVTWVNMDMARHNVMANSGEFDSLALTYGETFSFTFDEIGEFLYFNKNYPDIKGKVVVVP
jgi:plastocyanin